MLFFIHASSRKKHPQSSSLVFKTSFCCDSTASLPAQHQDHSQDPLTAPLFPSTGLTLWQELSGTSLLLFPGTIPHHKAWFCSSHAEDLPQELPQLHPSLVQYLPLLIHFFPKDHGRDTRAPHCTGPTLFLDWLSWARTCGGLGWPQALCNGLQGRKGLGARFVCGISWNPFKSL